MSGRRSPSLRARPSAGQVGGEMCAHNMSWIRYPSRVSTDVEAVIAAQSAVSRCTLVYAVLFVPVSLAAGLFNLATFLRGRARLGGLDVCLLDLTATGLLATLLSLAAIGRPDYLATTNLGCAVLSLLSNACYFNAQYVQLVLLFAFLLRRPPPCLRAAAQGPWGPAASLAAAGGCAVCSSLGAVALLGTSGELDHTTLCQADPLTAWPEYEMVKVSLGFGLALVLQLAFLVLLGVQRARRAAPAQRDAASACPVVPAIVLTTFACRLFYNVALVRRARLKLQRDIGSPGDELLMNLAELALFGESCVGSLATLFLHKPCRLALRSVPARLCQSCRRGAAGTSFALNGVGG